MANIPDDFGRLGRFSSADFEEIKKALTVAVGDAVKFNSESKTKEEKVEPDNLEKLVNALSELADALGENQDNIKESIRTTKEFVEEVKQASEEVKVKKQKAQKEAIPLRGDLQSAQKIILQNKQKAEKEKINKFTSGAAVLDSAQPSVSIGDSFDKISRAFSPRRSTVTSKINTKEVENNSIKENEKAAENILGLIARTFSLKSLGFKAKGADTVPAVLKPGELVVSKENTDKLKSGSHTLAFSQGGIVKPQYLSTGSKGTRVIPDTIDWALGKVGMRISPEIGEPKNKDKAAQQMEDIGKVMADRLNSKFESETKRDLAAWATGMSSMLLGGGANFLQALFSGSVKDVTEYRQESDKLAYQLEGLTEKERGLQAGFADLGDVYRQTGKRAEVMQKVLLSNVKKGLKNNVETKKVMKSSLHLSTMIGSNAEQTADLFGDWHRTLGLGADQMSRLANDSKLLARSTGITGDELIGVMKSSEGILKNLRNQGNLTSDSARNVLETMANATRLGIGDEAKNILDMMSNSTKLLTSGDPKLRQFILGTANQTNDRRVINAATTGTLTKDRGLMKQFSGQMNKFISQLTGKKYSSAEEVLEKGTDQEKADLSLALESYSGMDLYTYDAFAKSIEGGAKSLDERLKDFDNKINSKAATAEEKQAAERQKRETVLFTSFGKMQEFSSQLQKGGEKGEKFDQILQRSFEKMSEDQKTDLKTLESKLSSTDKARLSGLSDPMRAQMTANLSANQKLQEAAEAQGKTVKDFGPEIEAALKSGDMEKYRSTVKEMDESMKALGVKEEAGINPMKDLADRINELNQTIRTTFGGLTQRIIELIGGFGLFAIQVGLLITSLYATFGDKFLQVTGLGKLIPKIEKIAKLRSPTAAASAADVAKNPFASMGGSMGQAARKTSGITGVVDDVVVAQETIFGKFKSRLGGLAQSFDDFFYGPIRRGLDRVAKGADGFLESVSKYEKLRKSRGIIAGKRTQPLSVKDAFVKAFKLDKLTDKFKKTFASLLPKRFKKAYARALDPESLFNAARSKPLGKLGAIGQGIKAQLLGFVDDIVKGVLRFGKTLRSAGGNFMAAFNNLDSNFITNTVNLVKRIKNIPRLLSGGRSIGNLLEGGILGTFKGLSKGISGGAKLLKGAARLSPLTIAFAAVDAAFGAVQGWQNAGKNFEGVMKSGIKGMEKLTFGMQISSSAGGALAGVLDGLTFGLLSIIGLKDGLAQFLGYVIYAFGVLGHAIGEGFGSWLKPIQESLSALGRAFLGIFNAIMGIFGFEGASDMAGAFAGLYKILQPLGYAIGWLVGGALKLLIDVIWVVAKVVEGLAATLKFVLTPITALVGVIGRMVSGVVDWFMWLYKVVFGNSIIPDLCIGIVAVFAKMAIKVLGALGSFVFNVIKFFALLPFKILGFFIKLPFKIMGAMYKAFVKWPLSLFARLMNFLTGGLFSKGLTALSTKVGEFFGLFKKYLWDFAKIAFQSWYKLLNWISGGWLDKIVKGISNLGGKIITLVDDYLIKPISSAFQKIATLVDDYLIKPITALIQKVMSYLPKWMTGGGKPPVNPAGVKGASAVDDAAKAGTKAATSADDVAKGAVKGAEAATKAASTVDDAAAAASKASTAAQGASAVDDAASVATKAASKGTGLLDDAAKVVASGADDVVKAGAGGAGAVAGKAAGSLAKKIPVVGPLIDFTVRKTLLQQDTTQAAGGAISGAAGGLAGAAAGAAIGSVVPVVGTVIGGIIGGIAGGMGGGWLWDSAYESVTGKGEDAALEESQSQEGIGPTMVEQGDAQLAQGDIVVKTMEMAQEPGSMYVHDIHTEKVLYMILESIRAGGAIGAIGEGISDIVEGASDMISNIPGGALAGAAIGTAILPGIGTLAGGLIGSMLSQNKTEPVSEESVIVEESPKAVVDVIPIDLINVKAQGVEDCLHAILLELQQISGSEGGVEEKLPQEAGFLSGIVSKLPFASALSPAIGGISAMGSSIANGISNTAGLMGQANTTASNTSPLGSKGKSVGKQDFTATKVTSALEGQRDLTLQQVKQGDVMEKTMEMGQKPGSMYVHDVHCEALLYLILKQLGWDPSKNFKEYDKIMKNLKDSPERGIEKTIKQDAVPKLKEELELKKKIAIEKRKEANNYLLWGDKKKFAEADRAAKEAEAASAALEKAISDIEEIERNSGASTPPTPTTPTVAAAASGATPTSPTTTPTVAAAASGATPTSPTTTPTVAAAASGTTPTPPTTTPTVAAAASGATPTPPTTTTPTVAAAASGATPTPPTTTTPTVAAAASGATPTSPTAMTKPTVATAASDSGIKTQFTAEELAVLHPPKMDALGRVKPWKPGVASPLPTGRYISKGNIQTNQVTGESFDRYGNPVGGFYNAEGTKWTAGTAASGTTLTPPTAMPTVPTEPATAALGSANKKATASAEVEIDKDLYDVDGKDYMRGLYEEAGMMAKAKLAKQLGTNNLSGIVVDYEKDLEKGLVKATASASGFVPAVAGTTPASPTTPTVAAAASGSTPTPPATTATPTVAAAASGSTPTPPITPASAAASELSNINKKIEEIVSRASKGWFSNNLKIRKEDKKEYELLISRRKEIISAQKGIDYKKVNEDGTYTLELPAGRFKEFGDFDRFVDIDSAGLKTTTLETKSSAELAPTAKSPEDYLVDDMGPQRTTSNYDPNRYLTNDRTTGTTQPRNFSDRVLERARMKDAQNTVPANVETMEGREGILARFVAADTVASAAQGQSVTFDESMRRMQSQGSFDSTSGAKEEELAKKQTEIERNTASSAKAAETNAEAAVKSMHPGSIYVHDIHAEEILQHLLGQVGAGNTDALELANEKVGYAQDLLSKLTKETMEANKATTDGISKTNQDSNKFTEDLFNKKPKIPDSVYAPIKTPAKDPMKMKAMDWLQKEIMKTGMEEPLIPSTKASMNITDLEDKTMTEMEKASIAASIPVGQHAIPVVNTDQEDSVGGVQPVHLRDITDTILREKASTQSGTNKLQSDELTRMEEVANKQVQELTEIKEGIQQVVHLLTPKGTSIAGQSPEQMEGRTKDPRRPLHAVAMGKMKYKGPGSTANRATINTGEC